MSNAVLQASILSINGGVTVGAGAMITVRTPAGALVSLYEDRDGLTPAGNPVYADSNGFFRVYAAAGRYNITVTTGTGTQQYADIVIEGEAEAKRNIAAVDPVVTDDETAGYSEWSLWANTVTSEVFRCIDATASAAAWVKTTLTVDELGSAALVDIGTTAGTAAAGDHDHAGIYEPVDADILRADTADILTAGYAATPYSAGTFTTGTYTPDEANGNLQYAVNGGAHTLAPPTNNCTLVIQYTNNASAGAITTSGFTIVDGAFTTTNGDDFFAYVVKNNGFSHLNILALQ
jgi:hypothetical protein